MQGIKQTWLNSLMKVNTFFMLNQILLLNHENQTLKNTIKKMRFFLQLALARKKINLKVNWEDSSKKWFNPKMKNKIFKESRICNCDKAAIKCNQCSILKLIKWRKSQQSQRFKHQIEEPLLIQYPKLYQRPINQLQDIQGIEVSLLLQVTRLNSLL